MKIDPIVLVVDVESTAWEPKNNKPYYESSEIIEIGISVVNTDSFEVCSNTSILVKPTCSKVSEFCTKLTTLTQEQVDEGISFYEAVSKLKKEFSSSDRIFISWGDYDRKQFERNCKMYKCDYPFGARHINLKNCFALLNGLDHELEMGAALDYLKLPLHGTHHRGHDDAANIANILVHTLKKFRSL